ncbi:PP2C family protein-serine/threonine phosphatase [Anaerostipes caccae]|uniref:PP2C family protein-serine/threonine phosphatase n=1 Tax=Anaerostipes caccae TaxID=105841 RepID=UPI00101C6332|nr:protein phosphatase 2C domain-containing protein [Anaerostipes caccae]
MAEIDAFVYTSPGGRTVNEDYCSFELGSGRSSFVVADGLGGHEKGEIASELAGRFMMERLMCMDQITVESLKEALRETNQCVLDGQNQYPGMRTTMAAVIEEKGQLWECHTGDSRIYLFKNRCLYFQSRDHSVVQLSAEMGDISPEQIRFHPDRSKLLKVLGDSQELKIAPPPESFALEPGDAFLLCTDGFWEYVWETEMEADLVKSETPEEWIVFMVKRVLLKAPSDHDNFTAAAGMVRSL